MIPSPWNLENSDSILFSPDGRMKVQYRNLYEIKMGSPLAGEGIIEYNNSQILIDKMCACPPIWSNSSQFLAIPIWTNGMAQEIGVIDVQKFEIWISKAIYRVVHFSTFYNNFLEGTDSPVYMPKNFRLDIAKMEFRKKEKLRYLNLL
jgi:hypothetical protein